VILICNFAQIYIWCGIAEPAWYNSLRLIAISLRESFFQLFYERRIIIYGQVLNGKNLIDLPSNFEAFSWKQLNYY